MVVIRVMCQNDADGISNSSEESDETVLQKQSDLELHCLPKPVCPNEPAHEIMVLTT